MKKILFLIIATVSFFIISVAKLSADNSFNLIKAKGRVNTNDIGGKGLCVFSIWDKGKGSFVASDGTFVTIISDFSPQKLLLKDSAGQTRALTVALPGDSKEITFDAASSAAAILFSDMNYSRSSDLIEVKKFLKTCAGKKSFQDLVGLLRKRLPHDSLEKLEGEDECISLLAKCRSDIFEEDRAAINKSLYEAEEKLKKSLYVLPTK